MARAGHGDGCSRMVVGTDPMVPASPWYCPLHIRGRLCLGKPRQGAVTGEGWAAPGARALCWPCQGHNEPPGALRGIHPVALGCGTQLHWPRGSPVPSATAPALEQGHQDTGKGLGVRPHGHTETQCHHHAWPTAQVEDQEWKDNCMSPAGDSLRDKLRLEVPHYLPWDTVVGHRVGSTPGRVGAHLQWPRECQWWCAHGARGHGHGTWEQVTMGWDWCP